MRESFFVADVDLANIHLLVTHDGVFHADEVTAIAIIRLLYAEAGLQAPDVLRTRRPVHLGRPDNLLVDVGGEFDPDRMRFDHHFTDSPVHEGTEWKYSSAGLVWAKFGRAIITARHNDLSEEQIDIAVDRFMSSFILPVDMADNGQVEKTNQPLLTYSMLIAVMNPPMGAGVTNAERGNAFMKAVEWAAVAIKAEIDSIVEILRQRDYVLAGLEDQLGSDIFVLNPGAPWIGVVLESEEHFQRYGGYKVAIFPDTAKSEYIREEGEWRIQSFPGSRDNKFEMRCPAPENLMKDHPEIPWIFVHPGRFIGGVRGDLQMALKAARAWIDG